MYDKDAVAYAVIQSWRPEMHCECRYAGTAKAGDRVPELAFPVGVKGAAGWVRYIHTMFGLHAYIVTYHK